MQIFSNQFNIEIHKGFGGSIEQWTEWFDLFKDTHTFYVRDKYEFDDKKQRIYHRDAKMVNTYRLEYMLVKK